eukprot:4048089-Pleurochrysis_carterae.AAC.6
MEVLAVLVQTARLDHARHLLLCAPRAVHRARSTTQVKIGGRAQKYGLVVFDAIGARTPGRISFSRFSPLDAFGS